MKFSVCTHTHIDCLRTSLFILTCESLTCSLPANGAVKYEAHLENGTLVSKSDGVEFTVKDG